VTTRRRLLAVTVAGALAVTGLAGCRSAPGVAAYVGPTRFSEQWVDKIVDSVRAQIPEGREFAVRQQVVEMLVVRAAVTQYAAREGITIPPVDPAAFAKQNGLPPDTEYSELAASYSGALSALQDRVKSTAPSEADQREAYGNARVNGQPVTDKFEDVQQYFTEEQLGSAVGQRNLLNEILMRSDVVVNPRYGPMKAQVQAQIGQVPTWLGVPLGDTDGSPAVVNRQ
jgi:hypothetical protein